MPKASSSLAWERDVVSPTGCASQVRDIKRFSLSSESASCRLPGISSQPRTSMLQAYLEIGCVRSPLHSPIFGSSRPQSTAGADESGQGWDVAGRVLREPWLCFSGVQRQPVHPEERGGHQRRLPQPLPQEL